MCKYKPLAAICHPDSFATLSALQPPLLGNSMQFLEASLPAAFKEVRSTHREWFVAEIGHKRPDWPSIKQYEDTAKDYKQKMEKFIGDGKVECVGLYIDTKGILLIFKTTSPKIKAEAQKYVDNMQKILNIEGPRLSDSCCAFDEYHRERVQQWMTHAKIAKDFVESDDEEEKEDCHILAKAETAIMQVCKASAATQKGSTSRWHL